MYVDVPNGGRIISDSRYYDIYLEHINYWSLNALKYRLYEDALKICKEKDAELVELRLFYVYGDDDSEEKFFNYCISKMIRNRDINVSSCRQMMEVSRSTSRISYSPDKESGEKPHCIVLSGVFQNKFEWISKVLFKEGVAKTVEYYVNHRGGVKPHNPSFLRQIRRAAMLRSILPVGRAHGGMAA